MILNTSNSIKTLSESFTGFLNNFIDQLPGIGIGILIIVIGLLISSWLGKFAQRKMARKTEDPLMSKFLAQALKYTLIVIVVMLALKAAGLDKISTAIFTAAGASAFIFGFAFKDIGENFIAGIILAFNRPYNVNDTVQIGDNFGKVKTLEFRYTKLKTFDGKDVYIPNSDVLTKPVTNYTEDGFFRMDFMVGIAYEDNIVRAKEVIIKALNAEPNVVEDDEHENFVVEEQLATSTVNLKIFFWVETLDFRRMALITKGNVIRNVKEALEQNGFYMPADIQEIKLYGAEKDFKLSIIQDSDSKKSM